MCSHVMGVISCQVMQCNGMRFFSEFVMRCHVVWFEVVVWGELEDDLVIRKTQIYSVLHSTTKYYSSTTLYYTVLLQCYSVLQSTTPYYKVLLQYYSVLQSTSSTAQGGGGSFKNRKRIGDWLL